MFYTKEETVALCPELSRTRKDSLILLWKNKDPSKSDEELQAKWDEYKKTDICKRLNDAHLEIIKIFKESYGWEFPGVE